MTKNRIEKKFDRYYGGIDILFLSCIVNFIAIGFFLALSGTDPENGYTALFMIFATAVMLIGMCRLITANVAFAILYFHMLAVKNTGNLFEIAMGRGNERRVLYAIKAPAFLQNRVAYTVPSLLIMTAIVLEIFLISKIHGLATMTVPAGICLALIVVVSAGNVFVEYIAMQGMTPVLQLWENICNIARLVILFLCVRLARREFDRVRKDASYLEVCRDYTVTYADGK